MTSRGMAMYRVHNNISIGNKKKMDKTMVIRINVKNIFRFFFPFFLVLTHFAEMPLFLSTLFLFLINLFFTNCTNCKYTYPNYILL